MFPNVKNNFNKEIHKYVYVIKIQRSVRNCLTFVVHWDGGRL